MVSLLFPRIAGVSKGDVAKFAKGLGVKVRNVGEYVFIDGRGMAPSSIFYEDTTLLGAKQIDIAKEEAWFKDKFGDKVDYVRTKSLIDGHAMGAFRDASVFVYENATEGTMYHEAFHATTQMFLTPSERRSLYAEYRRRDGVNKELTDAQIEEELADEFADYILTDGKYTVPKAGKEQKTVFRKLLDMIKELFLGPTPSIEEVYQNITSSRYSKPLPLSRRAVNFINGRKGKTLYRSAEITYTNKEGQTIPLTITQKRQLVEGVNKFFIDSLFQAGDAELLFNNKINLEALYQSAKSNIIATLRNPEITGSTDGRLAREYGLTPKDLNALGLMYTSIIGNQWDAVKALHKEYLVEYGIQVQEKPLEDGNEIDTAIENVAIEQGRNNMQEATKFDTKTDTPNAVRALIQGIPKMDSTGTPSMSAIGLPELVNYNEFYNFIARELANTPAEWPILRSKLEGLTSKKAEVVELLKRLDAEGVAAERLRTKFIQNFSKAFNTSITALVKEEDGKNADITFIDSNANRKSDRIKDKWRANLGNTNINQDLLDEVSNLLEQSTDKATYDKAERLGFIGAAYNKFGISFTDPNVLNSPITTEDGKKIQHREMLSNIVKYVTDEEGVVTTDDLYSPKSDVAGRINQLVALEADNNYEEVDLQHISADGQTVYSIGLNTYMTHVANELGYLSTLPKAERRKEFEARLPHLANSEYSKDSIILDLIIEEGNTMTIGLFDGIRKDVVGSEGNALKNLNEGDKYIQLFNGTLKGYYSFIRAADRGVENIIQVDGLQGGLMVQDETDTINKYKEYLKTELMTARALISDSKVGNNIIYYRDMFKKDPAGLRILSDVITNSSLRSLINAKEIKDEKGEVIGHELVDKDDESFLRDFENASETIENDIRKYLQDRYTEETKELIRIGAISEVGGKLVNKGGISKDIVEKFGGLEQAIEAFVQNTQVGFIEQTKLFTGDLALYKNSDDIIKRLSMINSSKKISRTDSQMDAFLNKSYPRTDNKSIDRRIIKTIVYEDVVAKSTKATLDYLKDIFTKSLLKDGFTDDKGKTLNLLGETKLAGMVKPYEKMDEGDAAGFITLDEYRDLLVRAGDWTEGHDTAYGKAIKGKPLTAKDLNYLQPLKTQYTGPLVDGEFVEQGIYVHAGYKHALTPLLPAAFEGTQMKGIINHMKDNQVGIWQFRSGNKFGTKVDDNGNPNEFYRTLEDGTNVINTEDLMYQSIDYKYMGIQLDIAPKVKEKVTAGTQMRKLILSNIFRQGEAVNSDLGKLAQEYLSLQNEIIEKELMELMEELTIVPTERGYEINNPSKLAEFLTKAAKTRGVSNNVLDAITDLIVVDGEGNQTTGLIDSFPNKDKVENLLMALMNNNVIREKRFGGAKAQIPSSGYEVNARKKDDSLFTSNELSFYSDTQAYMEVAIPLPKKLLVRFGSLEAANAELAKEDGGLLKELRDIIGFRIPTQGLNSMEVMRIKKFLPAEMGDVIMMPTEIVAKAGSDYDIDKLNLYFKDYDLQMPDGQVEDLILKANARLKKNDYVLSDDLLSTTPEGIEEYNDIIDRGMEDITSLDRRERIIYDHYIFSEKNFGDIVPYTGADLKGLKNKLFDTSKQILQHEENRAQLLAPVDDSMLKSLVSDIRGLMGISGKPSSITNITEAKTNIEKFKYFLSGKAGVGQVAVHSTHHILTQIANTYVKQKVNLFFEHQSVEIDGLERPSLAHTNAVSGEGILASLSEFMNAYVDIAKDPYIFDLNAGNDTANTIFYMLRLGVDPKWLGRFMAQPSIQAYVKAKAANESTFLEEGNKLKRKDIFTNALKEVGSKGKISYTIVSAEETIEEYKEYSNSESIARINKAEEKLEELTSSYERRPSMDSLGNMIEKYAANPKNPRFTAEQSYLQKQLLDNYLDYSRQSGKLQKLIRATSPDTKGTGKNLNALQDIITTKEEVLNEGFFGNVQPIFDNTFIGQFQKVLEVADSTYSKLTILRNPKISGPLQRMMRELTDSKVLKTAQAKQKARDKIETEFLRYVLFTAYGKNFSMTEKFLPLFQGSAKKASLPRQIYNIQKGKNEDIGDRLKDNLLIKELIPMLDRKKTKLDNLKFFNRRVNTQLENNYIEAFEEIQVVDAKLAQDIATFAFMQSGFANSPISFSKYIPHSLSKVFLGTAVDAVNREIYIPEVTYSFKQQFYRNNTNFVPKANKVFNQDANDFVNKLVLKETDSNSKIPFMKTFDKDGNIKLHKALEPNEDGKVQYVYDSQYQPLGDGMYYKIYRKGDNLTGEVFQNEDQTQCLNLL
jgi:hypothetical protein